MSNLRTEQLHFICGRQGVGGVVVAHSDLITVSCSSLTKSTFPDGWEGSFQNHYFAKS